MGEGPLQAWGRGCPARISDLRADAGHAGTGPELEGTQFVTWAPSEGTVAQLAGKALNTYFFLHTHEYFSKSVPLCTKHTTVVGRIPRH